MNVHSPITMKNSPPTDEGPWYAFVEYGEHVLEPGRYWVNKDAKFWCAKRGRYVAENFRASRARREANPKKTYRCVSVRSSPAGRQVLAYTHVALYRTVLPDTPKHLHIDHIDRDPTNNQLENLRALEPDVNIARKKGYGTRLGRRLTADEVAQIDERLRAGKDSHSVIANDFGVSCGCIEHIAAGRSWSHITGR